MGDSLARVITIGSIVFTVAALGLAVLLARKASRIRLGFDVARAVVGLGAIVVMAAITHVATPLIAVVAAVVVGLALGYAQGATLDVTSRDQSLFATRSPVGIALWGVGIVVMQSAGIASRTGALKIGQTIAWFSVCLGIGMLVGRNGPVREARRPLAGTGSAAAVAAVALPALALVGAVVRPAAADEIRLSDDEVCALIVPGTSDLLAVTGQVPARDFGQYGWIEWEPAVPVTGSLAACRQTGYELYTGQGDIAFTVYLLDSEAEAVAQFEAEVAAQDAWHGPVWEAELEQLERSLAENGYYYQAHHGTGPLDDYRVVGRYWIDWGHQDFGDQRVVMTTGPFVLFGAVDDDLAFNFGPVRDDLSHEPDRFLIETLITPMADTVHNIEAFLAATATTDEPPASDEPPTTPAGDTPLAEDAPEPSADDAAPAGDQPSTSIVEAVPAEDAPAAGQDDVADAEPVTLPPVADVERPEDAAGSIEPTEAANQAVAGLVAAAAIGLITWAEAAGEITRIIGGTRGGSGVTSEVVPGPPTDPVVDEHGRVLLPGDDGLYTWDTPSGTERLPRDEIEARIAAERAAIDAKVGRQEAIIAEQQSDTAAETRMDAINARAEAADRAAAEALADEIEREQAAIRNRERVTDILIERAREGGWDPILDRLDSGEAMTREELIEIRGVLDKLTAAQGADDPATSGTFAGDLLDEFAKDAAVAQEAAAQVAEQVYGPVAGWVVRNPAIPARIAAAVATSGASELIFTPVDIWNAMDAAAQQAHAQGRDLTMAEAWAAGGWVAGPGMVIGKIGQVGLGAAAPHLTRVAKAAEETFETMSRQLDDAIRGAGRARGPVRAGSEIFEESMEAMSRRAAAPPRSLGAGGRTAEAHGLDWVNPRAVDAVPDFKAAPNGTIIPQSRITSDMGMPMENYRAARRVVQGNPGTAIEIRSTSSRAPAHLADGSLPKPASVKVKTANAWDEHLGVRPDDRSLVPWPKGEKGWPKPDVDTPPASWRPDLDDAARKNSWADEGYGPTQRRWEQRQQEWLDQKDKIDDLLANKRARVNDRGLLEMKDSRGNWQTITGDHDLYRIEIEVPPGLTPAQAAAHIERTKANVMAELRLPPFSVQHGAHVDWVPVTEVDRGIDRVIRGSHGTGGGDALLRVQTDVPAHVTYSDAVR